MELDSDLHRYEHGGTYMSGDRYEKEKSEDFQNPPDYAEVCHNCMYLEEKSLFGTGMRCSFAANKHEADIANPVIPSRWHSCDHFHKKS